MNIIELIDKCNEQGVSFTILPCDESGDIKIKLTKDDYGISQMISYMTFKGAKFAESYVEHIFDGAFKDLEIFMNE